MAKAKVTQLKYKWVGSVLVVTSEDLNRSEEFDTSLLPQNVKINALELGFKTKISNYATDADGHAERLDAMVEGFGFLKDGEWSREREPLPGWIKTTAAKQAIAAIALLKGRGESEIRKALVDAGEKSAQAVMSTKAVQDKMRELVLVSGPIDLTDL